ncbi:hypothetical protein QBC37DRAFT_371909 [Rhypophila decipiens]|uniref:Uncharacterized protein n=1 Tax=Rhypophila decipiens TaxID=261697 RepID=A0AAN6YG06_9PEZI|nr:hypothetical protein QBC37DRAFT_371909 [Rhypophila decipiens]
MQFSQILAGVALLITGLTPVMAAHIDPGTVSELFEKRGECEIKGCGSDSDCNRFCTDGCDNGRCRTSWSSDRPGACARGCKINKE